VSCSKTKLQNRLASYISCPLLENETKKFFRIFSASIELSGTYFEVDILPVGNVYFDDGKRPVMPFCSNLAENFS
jgi:hypothetical protein